MWTIMKELIIAVAAVASAWSTSGCRPAPSRRLSTDNVWQQAHALLKADHPPSSEKYLEAARLILDFNGPEAERRFCEETIAHWPKYAAAHFVRARWQFRFGDIGGAATEANLALCYVSSESDTKLAQRIKRLLTLANFVLGRGGESQRPCPSVLRQTQRRPAAAGVSLTSFTAKRAARCSSPSSRAIQSFNSA